MGPTNLFSLLLFLFSLGKIRASSKEPSAKILPAENASTPEPEVDYPYFMQERFLEANFFQDYLILFKNMDKNVWINHLRYFFVSKISGRILPITQHRFGAYQKNG